MKNKTHIISNFKFNPIGNNDNSVISEMYNVNFDNGILSSELSYINLLNLYFNQETILQLEELNQDIIYKITQIIPYDFYSDENKKIIKRFFVLTNDNKFFELNLNSFKFEEIYNFLNTPKIITLNNNLYLFEDSDCIIIQNLNIPQIEKIPTITNFINLNNKTFFTYEKYPTLIFETEYSEIINLSENIEQYTQYKINSYDGNVLKIFTIKNKLYILTQYSIYQLDTDNNSLNKILSIDLKIFNNCIYQIDNSIIFLTSYGLFLFDGIDLNLLIKFSFNLQENANLICFNRNIYVFDSISADLVYKINTDNFFITPIKIQNLNKLYLIRTINNYTLCANIIEDGKFKNISLYENNNGNSSYQIIKFKPLVFNSIFDKTIKNIYINLDGECELIISSNYSDKCVYKIKNNTQLNDVNIYGSIFNFEILSEKHFKLESILILLEEES